MSTVKDFIPLSEAKKTTEKEVIQKPSTAELTKIEKPGKPVPASFLEESKPKKRRKKKSLAKSNLIKQNKDAILIITEKPQAAQKIAQALSKNIPEKTTNFGVSYYEFERNKEKIIVCSAVGHLFNLTYVKGQRDWPIFNLEWTPSYLKSSAAFTKKYLELIQRLSNRAKDFIIATDYDIEGEVIGWNVLRFVCKKEDAKRMKYSTLTKNELEKSYNNLLPHLDWGHAYAGEARHKLDWLYGINLSRALMSAIKKTGSFKILSIGRVQGPALKIIVDRELEIKNFKSEPYWKVIAIVNSHNYTHPKDIFEKSELEKFKNIKEALAETKTKEESIKPPTPFDLTTLQREAYRLHKISPSETLKLAQKLYLDGIISYPRTSSQKIPEAIKPKAILKRLSKRFPKEVSLATRNKPLEGPKSDPAHPSIYPTGEFKKLAEREEKLYNIIAKRFIACFAPDAKTANKRTVLESIPDKLKFTASALTLLDKGWTKVYPTNLEESSLPDLNGKVKIDEIKFQEKETQPPKRYTPASLITTLEKKNLGTKATRSTIVDTLFDRGYLDGRSIQATPLGMQLISSLEKYSPIIIDENLTKQLEEKMEEIQSSKDNFKEKEEAVIKTAEKLITDISKEFKANESKIGHNIAEGLTSLREAQQEQNTLLQCPTCKQGNLRILYSKKTKRQFVACSNYPKCTQTYSLPPNSLIKRAKSDCSSCKFPKLLSIKKARKPWEFCFNPECEDVKKRREAWEKRKSTN